MSDSIRFSVALDKKRHKKLRTQLVKNDLTGVEAMEEIIDQNVIARLRPALDATCSNGKKK